MQIGTDCEIIIDGVGYFVEPHTYDMKRPRIRKATITKDGSERYVDSGPGKREWQLILICANEMTDLTGQRIASSGLQLRNHLVTSYATRAPIAFTDLDGTVYAVHFDHYAEQVRSPRTQILGPSYHCTVTLVEA